MLQTTHPVPLWTTDAIKSHTYLVNKYSSSIINTVIPLRSRPPFAARGSGGALKLLQQVRAEPGRQTVFGEL